MVIQNLYETGSSNIVSVGLQDVATGKSRTNLYASLLSGAGALVGAYRCNGVLSNVKSYGDLIYQQVPINNTTYYLNFDMDFDIPQTIEGQTIVQVPLILSANAAWVDIDIQKIDKSSVMTSLVSGASMTVVGTTSVSGAVTATMLNFPRTVFKTGEKLRLRIWSRGTVTDPKIGVDPMDRAIDGVSAIPSTLIMQVPFKIDL